MSVVSLLGVEIKNNPAAFTAGYEFHVTFECLEQLQQDLEWKLTYVGSATSSEYDQELATLLVGPVPVGTNKFVFEADAPDLSKIPNNEILGVTVILLSCSYDGREFVRVGYYVNNEYSDEALIAEPPAKPVIDKVRRIILAEKPRVTRFAIKWDSDESAPPEFPPDQPEADAAEDDADAYGAEEEEEEELVEEVKGEDEEMAGADETGPVKDDASDAGSEDLEAESSGEEDEEEEEEEEVEGEADEDMDMGDDGPKAGAGAPKAVQQQQPDAMVH